MEATYLHVHPFDAGLSEPTRLYSYVEFFLDALRMACDRHIVLRLEWRFALLLLTWMIRLFKRYTFCKIIWCIA